MKKIPHRKKNFGFFRFILFFIWKAKILFLTQYYLVHSKSMNYENILKNIFEGEKNELCQI